MAELRTYNAKRRFAVTKEPPGKLARRGNAFVIQKHDARRLHTRQSLLQTLERIDQPAMIDAQLV